MALHICPASDCSRAFVDMALLDEHAEAVHSFNDVQELLRDSLKEKYGRGGDANGKGATYVWIADVAQDWVVFQVETDSDCNLYKASYTIDTSNAVTLSDPVEVVRRTVYEPIASSTVRPASLPGLDGAAKTAAKAGPTAAEMSTAEKALSAAQLVTYKAARAKGLPHALAMSAAKRVKG